MNTKAQPWFHSWYGDILGLHMVPLIFAFLAFMHWPPFSSGQFVIDYIIGLILLLDWGHIFAQWPRIFSNPLETPENKFLYVALYPVFIVAVALYVQYGHQPYVDLILVYFVVFHFIKQQYGLIRIYSKTDGLKSRFDSINETVLTYLTMVTPVVYWHIDFPRKTFYWIAYFFKSPYFNYLFYACLVAYGITFLLYVKAEFLRTRKNGMFNVPKNIALLAAAIGWGGISFATHVPQLIMFTVVFTHDLSYTFLVWITARRDKLLKGEGKVSYFSWYSVPGSLMFLVTLIFFSHLIFVLHNELARDTNRDYFIFGTFFNDIPFKEKWLKSIGWGLFFGTQAHHYFIDRFLWKKEKDYAFAYKTAQASKKS